MVTTKRNHDHDSKTNVNRLHTSAQFESIRLATRIHEWYRDRVPEEEFMKLPAQKGKLRISNADRAVRPMYLYDPEMDGRDLHSDHMVLYEPPQSSKWGPRPFFLAEIIYEYDTEDEGKRCCQHDS